MKVEVVFLFTSIKLGKRADLRSKIGSRNLQQSLTVVNSTRKIDVLPELSQVSYEFETHAWELKLR